MGCYVHKAGRVRVVAVERAHAYPPGLARRGPGAAPLWAGVDVFARVNGKQAA